MMMYHCYTRLGKFSVTISEAVSPVTPDLKTGKHFFNICCAICETVSHVTFYTRFQTFCANIFQAVSLLHQTCWILCNPLWSCITCYTRFENSKTLFQKLLHPFWNCITCYTSLEKFCTNIFESVSLLHQTCWILCNPLWSCITCYTRIENSRFQIWCNRWYSLTDGYTKFIRSGVTVIQPQKYLYKIFLVWCNMWYSFSKSATNFEKVFCCFSNLV